VKLSADGTVTVCGATDDEPLGVLQNAPSAAGQAAEVAVDGAITKVYAASAITYGQPVGTDASGHAVALTRAEDSTAFDMGTCLVGAGSGNAGQLAEVLLNSRGLALIKYTP